MQLAETYSTAAEEDGKRPLALITYAEAEPAHHSDVKALKPMLDRSRNKGKSRNGCWPTPSMALTITGFMPAKKIRN